MSTRKKLLWLGSAGIALLLLSYLAIEHAEVLAVISVLLFVGVAGTFTVIVLRSAFRWGRTAVGQWQARKAEARQVSKMAPQLSGDEHGKNLDQMAKEIPRPEAAGKSEADALLDKFIGDS